MQAPKFRQLQADLSVLRLGALARSDHDPAHPRDVFAWHLFNAAIGEALYPALQLLELAMRNRIDAALREWAGDAAWHRCELPLTPGQASRLILTLKELSERGQLNTPSAIISRLPLGFWTAFFNKHHAQTGIGHHLAKRIFPHALPRDRDIRALDRRLTLVRTLRNRVFHHERLVHRPELSDQHLALRQLIAGISPELDQLARAMDRFEPLIRGGVEPWRQRVPA
jgi:hypothetical protein